MVRISNNSIFMRLFSVFGPLKKREDDTGTYVYIGRALPGTTEAATTWQIHRITSATNAVDYAGGNSNFDAVWNDRTGLSYS